MSPDFLPPARCDFSHARKGKWPLSRVSSLKRAVFPFSRGKNRISQGVENRGSLISVPLALRGVCDTIATSIPRYEKYRCWASKATTAFALIGLVAGSVGLRVLRGTESAVSMVLFQGRSPLVALILGKKEYTPPPRDPSFLGLSPDPEVTEQNKLWCIPFSWENKGKGYTP